MRKIQGLVVCVLLTSACASPAAEIEDHIGHITVRNAYVVAAKTSENAEAFMEVTNNHDEPVTLTGASASFASEAQTTEDCSAPDPQPSGIVIEGSETVILSAEKSCLIFSSLKRELAVSDEVTFTLSFSDGHSVDVTAPVKAE